jgi:hypothetical protein
MFVGRFEAASSPDDAAFFSIQHIERGDGVAPVLYYRLSLDAPQNLHSRVFALIAIRPPVVQLGTPLIESEGLSQLDETVRELPKYPVQAEYKTMDFRGKNVHHTKVQGGHGMTVDANAPDQMVKAAIAASTETNAWAVRGNYHPRVAANSKIKSAN